MSLDHILLGLLRDPASGYDLQQEFQAGAATFWPARLSQIYPTLKRLERRGLLKRRSEPSPKGPPRIIYSRTAAGREELRRWLASGPQLGAERFAYIGQLCFMAELGDPRAAEAFLADLRRALAAKLDVLRSFESEILQGRDPTDTDDETFYDWGALRLGMASLHAKVETCDELSACLRERGAPSDLRTTLAGEPPDDT